MSLLWLTAPFRNRQRFVKQSVGPSRDSRNLWHSLWLASGLGQLVLVHILSTWVLQLGLARKIDTPTDAFISVSASALAERLAAGVSCDVNVHGRLSPFVRSSASWF